MDIFHITREKNKIIGWNNGKVIYTRSFDDVITAHMIQIWAKKYLASFGWITPDKMNMNIDYILKNKTSV